jgi:hypothetical protein
MLHASPDWIGLNLIMSCNKDRKERWMVFRERMCLMLLGNQRVVGTSSSCGMLCFAHCVTPDGIANIPFAWR